LIDWIKLFEVCCWEWERRERKRRDTQSRKKERK
jgi:hypothetical protein